MTDILIAQLEERVTANPALASILTQLKARREIGIERYGRSLETFNDRDALQDLGEELVDALQYLTQVRLEEQAHMFSTARSITGLLVLWEQEGVGFSSDLSQSLRDVRRGFEHYQKTRHGQSLDTDAAVALVLTELSKSLP